MLGCDGKDGDMHFQNTPIRHATSKPSACYSAGRCEVFQGRNTYLLLIKRRSNCRNKCNEFTYWYNDGYAQAILNTYAYKNCNTHKVLLKN